MDGTEVVCVAIILICAPLSFFLFRHAFRNVFIKKPKFPIKNDKTPKNIESRLRMNSSHHIDIFEDTGTILAIPNPLKKKSTPD